MTSGKGWDPLSSPQTHGSIQGGAQLCSERSGRAVQRSLVGVGAGGGQAGGPDSSDPGRTPRERRQVYPPQFLCPSCFLGQDQAPSSESGLNRKWWFQATHGQDRVRGCQAPAYTSIPAPQHSGPLCATLPLPPLHPATLCPADLWLSHCPHFPPLCSCRASSLRCRNPSSSPLTYMCLSLIPDGACPLSELL